MLEIKRIKKPQPEVCTEQRGSLKTKIFPGKGPEVPLKRWGTGLKSVSLLIKWAQTSQTQPTIIYCPIWRTLELHVYHKAYPRGFCLDDRVLTLRRFQKLCLAKQSISGNKSTPTALPLLLIICSHISMDQASPSIWQRFQEKIWTNTDREKTKSSNQ